MPRGAKGIAGPFDAWLGGRIRALRRAQQMPQTELADAIGVSFQMIQKYERGISRIAAATLVDLAGALDITARALLEGAPGTLRTPPRLIARIAAVLPCEAGQTPRQINEALPDVSRGTLCTALRDLVAGGIATFDGEIGARRYRRVDPKMGETNAVL